MLTKGSVGRALNGKMYNRAVRYVMLVFETLSRLLLEEFEKYLEDQAEKHVVENMAERLVEVREDLCDEQVSNFIAADEFALYRNRFIDFYDDMNENGGNLVRYWLSFIEMAKILLNLIYAKRTGSWDLFLESVKDALPYT